MEVEKFTPNEMGPIFTEGIYGDHHPHQEKKTHLWHHVFLDIQNPHKSFTYLVNRCERNPYKSLLLQEMFGGSNIYRTHQV